MDSGLSESDGRAAKTMIPDHAIIQTWARWPKKMLPEDRPGTLTNLVLKYGQAR
jgi:hypothetical protein